MHDKRCRDAYCRRPSRNCAVTTAGAVLLALGAAIMIWCIPDWAWAALWALVMIAAGVILLRLGRR